MSNFKMMVSAIVADAQRELNMEQASQDKLESVLDSAQFHKAIDKLASEFNKDSKLDSTTHYTYRKVMSGYDSRYMDKNDYRFASKTYHKSERRDTSTEYFDYLLKSQYGSNATVARERKIITESYDFDMTHKNNEKVTLLPHPISYLGIICYTMEHFNAIVKNDFSEYGEYRVNPNMTWKKVAKKPTVSTASIKKVKSLPKTTFIPEKPATSSTKDYKPSYENTQTFKVIGYKMYKKAIVIDVISMNEKRACGRFDEVIDGYDNFRNEYLDVDSRNENQMVQHIVFRYEPLDRFGKPNKYDGIQQLKDFLNSQNFIKKQGFVRVKDVLEFLVGYTIDIPNAMYYNMTSRSDKLTVYTVFGDFTDLDREFSEKDNSEYHSISDYTLRDKDSESTENIHESLLTPNYYPIIITYECHKEFRTQLELEYSHIGTMFD